jgi:hypothetical protein
MAGRSSWQGTIDTQFAPEFAAMCLMNNNLNSSNDLSASFNLYGGIPLDLQDSLPANSFSPDATLASLFTRSLKVTNGSVATAMSTLITVLSSMAYYDQMSLFETQTNATQVFFETVLYPQSYRGFTAVAVVLTFHSLLVAIITASFMAYTQYTMLGNQWQAVSQLFSGETETLILGSSKMTDKDVRKCLEKDGRAEAMVGVRPTEDEDKIGIATLRFRRKQV